MTVKQFKTPEQQKREEAHSVMIGLLDDMLERARDGEIISLAFAYVTDDGDVGSGWSGEMTTDLAVSVMVLNERFKKAVVNVVLGEDT